jgi:hypothetical protein
MACPFEKTVDGFESKTANIWFSNHLLSPYSSSHLLSTSVHPGGILKNSNLAVHVSEETMKAMCDEAALRTFKE